MEEQKKHKGFVTLEAAAAVLCLIPFIVGVCGLVDMFTRNSELRAVLDRVVYDRSIAPMRIQYSGANTSSVAHAHLRNVVSDMAVTLESELERVCPGIASSDYFLEVGYSEIDIDPQSGGSNGFRSFPFTFSEAKGGLSLPLSLQPKLDLEMELNDWAQMSAPSGAHAYALPTIQFSANTSAQRFLDSLIILSGRVAVSLDDGFLANSLDVIGFEPFVVSRKVVVLRGDVSS